MKESEKAEKAVNEYEENKKKIAWYRKRSNSRLALTFCKLMELVNEKCIKGAE